MKDSEVLWLLETLSSQGHPDPEGFVASLTDGENNPAKLLPEEGMRYGITNVDEPALSIYGAMARDKDNGVGDKYSSADRNKVRSMASNAIMNNQPPANPFIDNEGRWKMGFKSKRSGLVNESDLKKTIRDMI